MKRFAFVITVAALCVAASRPASAGLITFTTPDCGGFEACGNAAFSSAIGSPDVFLSLSYDKDGNVAPLGSAEGDIFSDLVTFSTPASSYSPADSSLVRATGAGTGSEIGPMPDFAGILRIDFARAASAVGFGTVQLGATESIRVFDTGGALIGTFGDPSNATFDYFGVLATGGARIGRIELEGEFFAIQDLTTDFIPNPEPSTMVLFGTGLIAAILRLLLRNRF